jgi:hypothetical protein
MMGLLDGGIAAAFAGVFGGVYLDAQLYRPAGSGDDGMGGGEEGGFADPEAVKVQVDVATDAMRDADGYVDTDVRILMLAHGVDRPTTDCQIAVTGYPRRFGIRTVGSDPAQSYWDIHGRLA